MQAASDAGLVLAIDVGGTGVKAVLATLDGTPLLETTRATPTGDGPGALAAAIDAGHELVAASRWGRPVRLGLAVPGIVDAPSGVARYSANLGWRDAPVAQPVADALDLPVALVHDVTAAGLAEHRLGAGRGVDDLLVVAIGTGIAAAVVVAGRPVTGGRGQAGELGHVVVRPGGRACGCGRSGCLEAEASASAIAAAYAERTGRVVDGAAGVVALLPHDADAVAVWQHAVECLADGLLDAVALLGSSRVVVGGGLSNAGATLLDPLARAMHERASIHVVPELVVAGLGARGGVVGAALVAAEAEHLHLPQVGSR
ncbi:ROK family protein [Angustibacter aerolatus]